MVLPNSHVSRLGFSLLLSVSFLFVAPAGLAQSSAPVPGGYGAPPGNPFVGSYPAPGAGSSASTSGGNAISSTGGPLGGYAKLPLNPGMAIGRLEELRGVMKTARPKDFQDAISEYTNWLADMADSHWKLALAFAKDPNQRGYADSERALNQKFGALKRQAMLLKGEFLVQQHRSPEALAPLVEIVSAEPKSETGVRAYQLLRDIGFSDATAAAMPSVADTLPAGGGPTGAGAATGALSGAAGPGSATTAVTTVTGKTAPAATVVTSVTGKAAPATTVVTAGPGKNAPTSTSVVTSVASKTTSLTTKSAPAAKPR